MPEVNGTQDAQDVTSLLDLDDIDNLDFDSIEDPPGFVTPPNGIYDLRITKGCVEKYKVKENPNEERKRFANYYEVIAVRELEDPNEQMPKEGDKFSERFMMNEQGMKYWKGKAKAILGDMGKVTVANVLKELSSGNYEFRAKITNKKSKNEKDGKEYTNTNVKVIARAADIPGFAEGKADSTATKDTGIAVE